MNRSRDITISRCSGFAVALMVVSALVGNSRPLNAQNELARSRSWTPRTTDQILALIQEWSNVEGVSEHQRLAVHLLLDNDQRLDEDPLSLVGDVISRLFPDTTPLTSIAERPANGSTAAVDGAQAQAALDAPGLPESARQQLLLLLGRWLARNELYDEALSMMSDLRVEDVVDPATLLFYRGICQHKLLHQDECVETLNRLLDVKEELPNRFASVGHLMLLDIEPMQPDSLDEISRLMDDVQRRQSLFRSGTRVRHQENTVVEKLDKLIDKLEEQKKQAMQQSASQVRPSNPMDDSNVAGGMGDGEVNPREQLDGGAWGNLPPREREAALAEMTKDLPPHFREVIEEYFRQLAREKR